MPWVITGLMRGSGCKSEVSVSFGGVPRATIGALENACHRVSIGGTEPLIVSCEEALFSPLQKKKKKKKKKLPILGNISVNPPSFKSSIEQGRRRGSGT